MRVGHIVATLKAVRRQHLMAADEGGRRVRGLFSTSRIARQLGVELHDERGGADVRRDRSGPGALVPRPVRGGLPGLSLAGPRALQHRAVRMPPMGARRPDGARSLWEDESGATASFTFAQLLAGANRLSNALAALGVRRGDRVALVLPQRPETVIAYLACFQMGAIAVPLSFLFGPDALEYRLADSGVEGRDRRSPDAAEPVGDPRAPARPGKRDRRGRSARGRDPRVGCAAGEGVRSVPSGRHRAHGSRRDHLHQRHDRSAEGRAAAAFRAARQPAGLRVLARRLPAAGRPASGRRRTGRGPAACGMR